MSEALTPEVIDVLVERHRRFLQFLEPRVGSRAGGRGTPAGGVRRGAGAWKWVRDGESAVAWFYRLLRNALLDSTGGETPSAERGSGTQVKPSVTERDPDLEAASASVHALIPTLKGSNVEILRAIEMEGQDPAAVAGRLGITRGNAAVRLAPSTAGAEGTA